MKILKKLMSMLKGAPVLTHFEYRCKIHGTVAIYSVNEFLLPHVACRTDTALCYQCNPATPTVRKVIKLDADSNNIRQTIKSGEGSTNIQIAGGFYIDGEKK